MKIGLEVHVALPTQSKLFCSCSTNAQDPNTAICPTCMGVPGSKPTLNKGALEYAVGVAKALKCKVPETTSFVRKVYFYPDLPKSFQVTQKDSAVGTDGEIAIEKGKKIGIMRVQLEEDPAKIMRQDDYTLIDFNRSGIPLVEIVTEPDIGSEDELRMFMTELKSILYYVGIDIDRELKADLNISVSKARVEVKNVTGMKNLIDATRYEVQRQEKLVKTGQEILQETRSYSEAETQTISSREKESDEEYGFIFEPDLTVYALKVIKDAKPVYASMLASDYAKKYKAKESTLRELIMFNSTNLALIDSARDRHDMKAIITAVELLQRYATKKANPSVFEQLVAIVEKGAYPDKEMMLKIEAGASASASASISVGASNDDIDGEIERLIKENSKLLAEYKKNPKVFNFIIGAVIKKYKSNPRIVSERLEHILKKEHN